MTEQATTDTTEGTTEGTQEVHDVNTLPEWARDKLTKANTEAAKYRTRAKEAASSVRAEVEAEFADKLAEATKAQDALVSEREAAKLEGVKLRAAFGALIGDPDKAKETLSRAEEFAGLIQGSTVDEIGEHAAKLAGLFGTSTTRAPAVDRSPEGGDTALALNGDPLLQSLKSALGI
ncbi:Hypothetical protein AJAP_28105 [Amycolatopsis japonica]|uniref:Scaffolding protein n=1 Tax=Amycolatopsis japonica TaxID=208439 RepID=A0A075V1I4_9PSEU|nr:hypothetical protein [Amycolatopsis japonica]AIG78459.1 Hypothetical protein AJAP_28105 [Amycolatopsis japonica]